MGLFDFGGDKVDFSGAENVYDQSSQQILEAIKQAQAQGRTDIADSLKRSLSMNQPYMQSGNTAMSAYLNSLGIGSEGAQGQQNLRDKFQQGPGYQYALQQAQLATQRKAAASGQGMSGAEQRELGSQAEGLANQDWSNWLGNYQNRLSDIAGIGQRSAMQQAGYEVQGGNWLANLGQNYTNMSTAQMQAAAKARAEAMMAEQVQNAQSSKDWWSGLGSLAGSIGGFAFGLPGSGGSASSPGAMDWLSKLWKK
jgi:hypothetical protein